MRTEPPEKLSEELGYQRLKEWLSTFGEVAATFVFAPAVTVSSHIEFFDQMGFIAVACPVLHVTKKEKPALFFQDEFRPYERDEVIALNKTDDVMIDVGTKMIQLMCGVTHICIASGDHHFIPLAVEAKKLGKKVMFAFSNYKPSRELLTFADRNPNNRRMLHLFNPIRD